MKISLSNLTEKISFYLYFDKLSWIFLILTLIFNLILWLVWLLKTHYNIYIVGFASFAMLVNFALVILFIRKDIIIIYFLLGSTCFVQILILILLKFTLFNG